MATRKPEQVGFSTPKKGTNAFEARDSHTRSRSVPLPLAGLLGAAGLPQWFSIREPRPLVLNNVFVMADCLMFGNMAWPSRGEPVE